MGSAAALILAMSAPVWAAAADFQLREHLGHAWENECVAFPLTPELLEKARKGLALVVTDGKEVAWQLVEGRDKEREGGTLQLLRPGEKREYDLEIGVLTSIEPIEELESSIGKLVD